MARAPEKSLKELIQDVGSAGSAPSQRRRAKTPATPQTRFLVIAVVLILAGAAYTVYAWLTRVEETPAPVVAAPHPDERELSQTSLPHGIVTEGAPANAPPPIFSENLRPAHVMQKLPVPLEKFAPVDSFSPPAAGKTLELWVLLAARLDSYTEQLWQRAGMFQHESIPISPFIRRVTVSDMESFTNLTDWHVESAALAPLEPEKEQ